MKTQSLVLPSRLGARNRVEALRAGERWAERSPGEAGAPRDDGAWAAR